MSKSITITSDNREYFVRKSNIVGLVPSERHVAVYLEHQLGDAFGGYNPLKCLTTEQPFEELKRELEDQD
jgi:hypothetical protein